MANITRFDPFDDLFRGFFARPIGCDAEVPQTPLIKMDVKEQEGGYQVHAERPGGASKRLTSNSDQVPSRRPEFRSGLLLCRPDE